MTSLAGRPPAAAPAPKAPKQAKPVQPSGPKPLKAPTFNDTAPITNIATARAEQAKTRAEAASGKTSAVAAAKAHAAKAGTAATGDAAATTGVNWLAPLTPAELTKQAKATIGAAYKPSFGDLNSQTKQLAAINAKRAQDNTAYEAWMAAQQSGLIASGAAADAGFAAQSAQASIAQQQAFAGQSGAAVQAADARQGNVSNNAASTPLTTGLVSNQNLNRSELGNAEMSATGSVQTGSDLLHADVANNDSRLGSNIAAQQSAYQTSLTAIAAQRSKLQLSKASDVAKEITRLQGIEIQKAQNQQSLTAAEQKLGLTAQQDAVVNAQNQDKITNTANSITERAKATQATLIERQNASQLEAQTSLTRAQIESRTSMSNAELEAAEKDKQFNLDQQKYGLAKAAQLWKEQHPTASNSNPGASPETANEQNELYNQIDKARGTLNALYGAYYTAHNGKRIAGSDTQVYQALAQGTPIQVGKTATGAPIMKTFPQVPPAILNAAFDLSHWRSGSLTPKDVAKLRAIGLRQINTRYTVG